MPPKPKSKGHRTPAPAPAPAPAPSAKKTAKKATVRSPTDSDDSLGYGPPATQPHQFDRPAPSEDEGEAEPSEEPGSSSGGEPEAASDNPEYDIDDMVTRVQTEYAARGRAFAESSGASPSAAGTLRK